MKSRNTYPYRSLLGIELSAGRLTAAVLVRAGQGFAVPATKTAALALDPLCHDPELAGQEIRNLLDQWGIREKRCVICIPLQWIMSRTIDLPDLPPGDQADYIRLQAEREFPFAAEDLAISLSPFSTPSRRTCATLAAIPRNHTLILQKVFRAAKLKPVSLTAGVASLGDNHPDAGTMILSVRDASIEIVVRAGGGVVGLRRLEYDGSLPPEDAEEIPDTVVREIRITLGQLPDEWRGAIRDVQVFGSRERTAPLLGRIGGPLEELGLPVVPGNAAAAGLDRLPHSLEPGFWPLAGTLLRIFASGAPEFEFLPPKVDRFKRITQRVSSRGNRVLAGAAAAVLLVAGSAFLYQYLRLSNLESEWNRIKNRAAQVEVLQKKVKQFRPWFDESVKSLEILKSLTEAFPEEGAVWAKILEIQDQSTVSCAGFAKSNADWLEMYDRLSANPRVADFQVQQVQGDAPLQFAFHFEWVEGGGHE
ncbi:MAG: hypothetical protein ACE15F_18610 [bacterium]